MTARTTAAAGRPDDAASDPYEAAIANLAEQADLYRSTALNLITSHVHAAAEVVRAREVERGGSFDADVSGVVEALRTELNAHLDRLAAAGGVA